VTPDESWLVVAATDDLEKDDVIEVTVKGQSIALYQTKDGYFATSGICTHQFSRLCEGFVFGNIIECGKHQGRFDVRTGAPKGAPAHVALKTYPVRIIDGQIELDIGTIQETFSAEKE